MRRTAGVYERSSAAGEAVNAFVPFPLPPRDPAVRIEGEQRRLLAKASDSLRLLEWTGHTVSSVARFVYGFVRREAVLSMQLDGRAASLLGLLEVEASGRAPLETADAETWGCVDALTFAWDELGRDPNQPVTVNLLSRSHERLLARVSSAEKTRGHIRRTQTWVGTGSPSSADFVPPPPHRLDLLLSDLERAMRDESDLPPLLRVGLLHAQFATLQPYTDANGQLGRLLVSLLLRKWGLLSRPLLSLSPFLKRNRREYDLRLRSVRGEGDWEGWLAFFLEAISAAADEAVATIRQLNRIVEENRDVLLRREDATVLSLRLFELLPNHPVLTVNRAAEILNCSRPAASKALRVLESAELLRPLDARKKNRTLVFEEYLAPLQVDMDQPPPSSEPQ
jgi:hypothetical protein